MIDESDTVLEKYTSQFIERVVCERELETEQNGNILTSPFLWPTVFLSRFPGLLNQWPGGPAFCWVLAFSTTLDSKSPISKLPDFLSTPSYIIVQSPSQYLPITGHRNMHFRRLWNGLFDCHQAEITVMQFTGHSLPVHQSVTVPWDFNPVPYCQPSSPMPMEYALPPSLEWHVWRSRPGRPGFNPRSSHTKDSKNGTWCLLA